MAKRRGGRWISLLGFAFLALAALSYTLLAKNTPVLGLDLQGGVSVVLQPKGDVPSDAIDQAIKIIRSRVDALGVAEPEITRQGNTILIQIPGVADRDRAIELVGQTAQLRFRPVCQSVPISSAPQESDTTDTTAPTDTTLPTDSTVAPDVSTPPASEQGLGLSGASEGELALGSQTDPTVITDSTVPGDPTTDMTVSGDPTPTTIDPATIQQPPVSAGACPTDMSTSTLSPTVCTDGTPDELDVADQPAVLPQCDSKTGELVAVYALGPTLLTGETLETARASLDQRGQWIVNPIFKDGASGIGQFNNAAAQCASGSATCPSTQLAIVLDGQVVSAPTIQEAQFSRDQIQISGSFTERTAKDLATVLKYGALPVEFEQQQVQIVSATLGQDALHAGLWSGLVGFVLVAMYMIAFYRLLGVLAIAKLCLEGALLWSVISYLGETQGLALTLAGITGLIVSIGVSVDSNVVYYEHMKEDVRNGRTVRSATDKAFISSWSTIVKADVASLIGAGLLWWLTVGPVRGFAFYLGLATVLDIIASYFYMRPVVKWAMNSKLAQDNPKAFGMPDPRDDVGGPNPPANEPAEVSS